MKGVQVFLRSPASGGESMISNTTPRLDAKAVTCARSPGVVPSGLIQSFTSLLALFENFQSFTGISVCIRLKNWLTFACFLSWSLFAIPSASSAGTSGTRNTSRWDIALMNVICLRRAATSDNKRSVLSCGPGVTLDDSAATRREKYFQSSLFLASALSFRWAASFSTSSGNTQGRGSLTYLWWLIRSKSNGASLVASSIAKTDRLVHSRSDSQLEEDIWI